jgi:hypothetical protein
MIHCRLLLMYLPDPASMLRALQAHLAPQGILLVEEPNMRTWGPADPHAPGAALLDSVIQRALAATEAAGIWRNALGPRLPTIFEQLGMQDVTCDGACWVAPSWQTPRAAGRYFSTGPRPPRVARPQPHGWHAGPPTHPPLAASEAKAA